jgi:fibro-slime domain-containing protein
MKWATIGLLTFVNACSYEASQGEIGVYQGPGEAGATDGLIGTPDAATEANRPPVVVLTMTLRDFKRYDATDPTTNPDFDNPPMASEHGVVADTLGADGKPVYQAPPSNVTTYGKTFFDQWYRDTPGTNVTVVYPLALTLTSDGQYEYDSEKSGTIDTSSGMARRVFFPLDDGTPYATPFGNQGGLHNYGFTGELHTVFTHLVDGGSLRFRSDDDMYVFIDKKLVIDLGGTHVAEGKEISTDELGLTLGRDYALDLFYAERMGARADLLITTSFELRPGVN